MSVARTARRRRRQASLGTKGLEQIYGKKRTPHYPSPMSREKSARLAARKIETERRMKSKGR